MLCADDDGSWLRQVVCWNVQYNSGATGRGYVLRGYMDIGVFLEPRRPGGSAGGYRRAKELNGEAKRFVAV